MLRQMPPAVTASTGVREEIVICFGRPSFSRLSFENVQGISQVEQSSKISGLIKLNKRHAALSKVRFRSRITLPCAQRHIVNIASGRE